MVNHDGLDLHGFMVYIYIIIMDLEYMFVYIYIWVYLCLYLCSILSMNSRMVHSCDRGTPPAADAGGHSTVNCVITGQIASCWWNDVT